MYIVETLDFLTVWGSEPGSNLQESAPLQCLTPLRPKVNFETLGDWRVADWLDLDEW